MSKNAPLQNQFGEGVAKRRPGIKLKRLRRLKLIGKENKIDNVWLKNESRPVVRRSVFLQRRESGTERLATWRRFAFGW